MNTKNLKKDQCRNFVVATRLTKQEHKIFKKLCKEKKVTFARLIRYSLKKSLEEINNGLNSGQNGNRTENRN